MTVRLTVVFRLTSDDGTVFSEDESVQIRGNDRITVVAEIAAPPGSYKVDAKVLYPPR
jgi:hypothetical protein